MRATGALAPIAIEEALVEVRAHAIRDELIGGELQAWMKMVNAYCTPGSLLMCLIMRSRQV